MRKDQLRGTPAAFCKTKIDDFRASSTLSTLLTWSLRKDQLRGTAATLCTIKIDFFDVELFDGMVEEAIDEGPARRDI